MEREVNTCADCPDYAECRIIQAFFAKNGYKYRKYRSVLGIHPENMDIPRSLQQHAHGNVRTGI